MHVQRRYWKNAVDWAWAELAVIARLEFLPDSWREPFAFGLRGWSACMLALYLAFLFQLDQPYWAGMTVWMVIQPAPGMAISKGFYRVVGTIIGAAMGVVLIALFYQTPELFILALGLWMGGTTVISNLLTNFRGYAAVLSGYTAAIVALGAYGMPNHVFDIAMARSAATIIGISCATVITVIFAPHRAEGQVRELLLQAISETARRAAIPLGTTLPGRLAVGRPLVAKLIQLDTGIEFAAAEASQLRIHAGLARSLVAHLFAVITAKRALEEHLGRVGLMQDAGTVALYHEGMKLFEEIPPALASGPKPEVAETVRAYNRKLWEHMPESGPGGKMQEISSRLVLDHLGEMTVHYERAVTNWVDIRGGWKRNPVLSLNFHRDRLAASINGLRAFLAVVIGGIFWIESEWPSGAFMLIQFAVGCGLFSAAPHPETVAFNFLKGVLVGTVAAYICTYHFLTNLTGFLPFALAQGCF